MIIYKNPDNSVSLIYPAQEFLEKKGEFLIALKDTPTGCPFWMVSETEIPSDFTFSGAWEVPEEWGPPDGYGSEFYTFEEIEDAQDKQ
jgi:hypothetical protein